MSESSEGNMGKSSYTKAQKEEIRDLSQSMRISCQRILTETMSVRANLSIKLFNDLVIHLGEDVQRQLRLDTKGLRPAKYAAYIAFWMRKIKPISDAYDAGEWCKLRGRPPWYDEIEDINEIVAIKMAFEFLLKSNEKEMLKIHKDDGAESGDFPIPYNRDCFIRVMNDFCHQKLANDGKCVLDTIINDMRYRTFGPHHLAHWFDQFVFRLSTEVDKEAPATA